MIPMPPDPRPHRRRPRRAGRRLGPLLVLALIGVAGCSGGDDTASTTVAATVAASTVPTTVATTTTSTTTTTTLAPATVPPTAPPTTQPATTTTVAPVPRQPLTGQLLADWSEVVNRPALVVKIDNAGPARRNHTGLAVADIVFEEIVEANITRFAAVFHSQDADPVGPIRSGRTQDVHLLTGLRQPLFAWSGGNPGVTRAIAESTFVDLNWQHTPGTYYRGAGARPHNLYSATQTLWGHIPFGHPGAPPQQFQYLPDGQAFQGDPISGVDVQMRSIDVSWLWDPSIGEFVRRQEGGWHVDKTYGQIHAANVVMMVVAYQPSVVDARSPEAQTIGNGPVFVVSDGKVVEGRWWRDTPDQPINLVDLAGNPLLLRPGTTWVELVEAIPGPDEANPGAAISFY